MPKDDGILYSLLSYFVQYSDDVGKCFNFLSEDLDLPTDTVNDILQLYKNNVGERASDWISDYLDTNALTQLEWIRKQPFHEQRTPEWFRVRSSVLTASSAYMILDNALNKERLVQKKVSEIIALNQTLSESLSSKRESTCVTSPLHWGHKYEPVSTMIYEEMFDVEIEEFGCIRHEQYSYLGASPDGIVKTPGPLFGRMLEIKNVVSRELTGVPKVDYWIQMQLQMEVCGLELCDFFECKFIEYESETQANEDGNDYFAEDGSLKGVILHYASEQAVPKYYYCPLGYGEKKLEDWEDKIMKEADDSGLFWVRKINWKLANYSLLTVKRNRAWFNSVNPYFKDAWSEINQRLTSLNKRE